MTDSNANINYSFADIERYLNGGMTAKEMHELEKAALQDPFLADAIEGYRDADIKLADKHLNEIAAALQKEEPAKVILMPKKKRYGWLVAASLLAVTGTGIFLFSGQNKSSKQIAENRSKEEKQPSLATEDSKMMAPQTDSQPFAASGNIALSKPEKKEADTKIAMLQKKKSSADAASGAKPQTEETQAPVIAMAAPAQPTHSESARSGYFQDTNKEQKTLLQPSQDSISSTMSLAEVVVTKAAKRQSALTTSWTTDKGKPFLLSDVEVINLDSRKRKHTDTSAIQPEGGWMAFQDYLFSRLSYRDSLLMVNNNNSIPDNIELEFSVDKSGLPYDVKVLNTQDSTVTSKIVTAIQSGPKWKSSDSKEKRLRIRY